MHKTTHKSYELITVMFIFLMLYQENECLAHLTVHFPNLEISKSVKKHRNVMGIFNPGVVSQISGNRG